jgi:hypothetical protein
MTMLKSRFYCIKSFTIKNLSPKLQIPISKFQGKRWEVSWVINTLKEGLGIWVLEFENCVFI